jgi:hypothetical protein
MAGVAPRLRAELRPEQAKATSGRSKIQGPKIAAMIQLRFFAESCFIPEDGTVGSEIQAGASLAGNDSSDASSTGSNRSSYGEGIGWFPVCAVVLVIRFEGPRAVVIPRAA